MTAPFFQTLFFTYTIILMFASPVAPGVGRWRQNEHDQYLKLVYVVTWEVG